MVKTHAAAHITDVEDDAQRTLMGIAVEPLAAWDAGLLCSMSSEAERNLFVAI